MLSLICLMEVSRHIALIKAISDMSKVYEGCMYITQIAPCQRNNNMHNILY